MITIFSIPKPFEDSHIIDIQTNAILSWLKLGDGVEVILVGNDFGVAEFCQKHNIIQLAQVECNEYGTPLISSAFSLVRQKAKNDILMYLNADIILTGELLKILKFLPSKEFLAVGRRRDLEVEGLLDFSDQQWETKINNDVKIRGVLHPMAGSDFFIFRKNSFFDLPAFAVGRIGWDNWLIAHSLAEHLPVIDISRSYQVIHQNHDYRHKEKFGFSLEDKKNLSFLRGSRDLQNTGSADYYLSAAGLKKKIVLLIKFKNLFNKSITRPFFSLLNIIANPRTRLIK